MILEEPIDMSKTRLGKDLISIGCRKGMKQGLVQVLTQRFGPLNNSFESRLAEVSDDDAIENLISQSITIQSIDDLMW